MTETKAGAGRPVLITGATSGIGLELAGLLMREGFRVFGGALPGEDTGPLAETGADIIALDVTDDDSLVVAREGIESRLGDTPLWGLVNNAGVVAAGPIELLDMAEARRVFAVNVLGVIAVTQTFLPMIRAAKGRIVNMSSLSALLAVPFLGPYNASKAAIESLSDSLRRELHPFGVHVITMQPGTTRTPIWKKAGEIDMTPFENSPYADAVAMVQGEALRKGGKGMRPAMVAAAILDALTLAEPPTRIRVQRSRKGKLRYSLFKFIPDRIIDRQVAKRVWGA